MGKRKIRRYKNKRIPWQSLTPPTDEEIRRYAAAPPQQGDEKVPTETASIEPVSAVTLSATEEAVFRYFAGQVKKSTGTVESTGLAENALILKVCNAIGTYRGIMSRLVKQYKLIESNRAGRAMVYRLTEQGRELIERLNAERIVTDSNRSAQEDHRMTQGLGDKLRAMGLTGSALAASSTIAPSTPSTSTVPAGIALPRMGRYAQNLSGIIELYKDRIKRNPEQNELERLREWFTRLLTEGRPAFKWMQEAICRTSTKVNSNQRTIAYMIGILKNWCTYGYGTDYSGEQKKVFDVFESRFNVRLSDAARNRFTNLVDQYGLVEAMTSIFNIDINSLDLSLLIVMRMEEALATDE